MAKCEVCGGNIYGDAVRVDIDGAILLVCSKCAKLGKPVKESMFPSVLSNPSRKETGVTSIVIGDDLTIRADFASVIKGAREAMGLTQEQLGMKINEKSSVIAKLESGKLKPSIQLAKKLEHIMKIKLLEKQESI